MKIFSLVYFLFFARPLYLYVSLLAKRYIITSSYSAVFGFYIHRWIVLKSIKEYHPGTSVSRRQALLDRKQPALINQHSRSGKGTIGSFSADIDIEQWAPESEALNAISRHDVFDPSLADSQHKEACDSPTDQNGFGQSTSPVTVSEKHFSIL